jgi:hypothetical protein
MIGAPSPAVLAGRAIKGDHMVQEHTDLEICRLYLNIAIECFNKAAIEEHADGVEVFGRMGRRYISEAEFYGATLQPKLAERLALPGMVARFQGRNSAGGAIARSMMLTAAQQRALAMLATANRNGTTQLLLAGHGFGIAMIAELANQGLATVMPSAVRADGKTIDFGNVRITDIGRNALAASHP